MAINPSLLVELDEIKELIRDVDNTLSSIPSLSVTLRTGLKMTLQQAIDRLEALKLTDTPSISPNKKQIEISGVGSKPVIELDFMTLRPATKEVVYEGRVIRLPRAEFLILYTLAASAGKEVNLGTGHSLLTRLSAIRRSIPATKQRIESLGKGKYVLNATKK